MNPRNFRNGLASLALGMMSGLALWAGPLPDAEAQGLFRSQSGSICEQAQAAELKPVRRTLVYVDRQILSLDPNAQGWLTALNQMLQQTMTTAEPLQVVVLDSEEGTAKTYGETLCYPMIAERYHELFRTSGISSLLTNDLIDQLPKLQDTLVRQLQDHVGPAYAGVPEQVVRQAPDSVGERHLLRALQADAARFSDEVPTRVIIYSDMIENSSLLDIETLLEASDEERVELARAVLDQLPRLDFQGAMVYGFGTGSTLNDPAATDALSSFMQQVVYLANGFPVGISRELSVRPVRVADARLFDTFIEVNGRKLQGRMRLMVDENGRLADSYLDLGTDNRSAHFESGRLLCSGDNTCQLEGRLATSLLFEDPEHVFLEGRRDSLQGHLGFRNDRMHDSENPALLPLMASSRR